MSPSSGGSRQYSEQEIAQLLKRATELQSGAPSEHGSGLTLEEVEDIARETGIDPAFVRAAASDLARLPEARRKFHVLGGPVFLEAERTVSAELTDEAWASMAAEMSRTFRASGKSEAVGSGREWTYRGGRNLREVRVSASPVKGKTRIRITDEYGREAFLMFFLTTYLGAVITGLLLGTMLALGQTATVTGIIAISATLLVAMRFVFGARVRSRERSHQDLLARLDHLMEVQDTESGMTRERASERGSPTHGSGSAQTADLPERLSIPAEEGTGEQRSEGRSRVR